VQPARLKSVAVVGARSFSCVAEEYIHVVMLISVLKNSVVHCMGPGLWGDDCGIALFTW
jgi:hypothetical protein